jgi:lysophospholipase L1-like esterase
MNKQLRQLFIALLASVVLLVACSSAVPQLQRLSTDAIILAFGDSLTYGYGVAPEDSYPTILAKLTQRKVVNAGLSGEISEHGLERLHDELETVNPDLVILCHAGNDLLRRMDVQQAKANLQAMINLIKQSGAQVVLVAVPKPSALLSPASFYQQLATDNQLPLVDGALSTILRDNSLKSDSVHPNAAGYHYLAEQIFALLQQSGAV